MSNPLQQSTSQPSPAITPGRQRLWWALVITLIVIFFVWGTFSDYPFNLVLWALSVVCLAIFISLIYREIRPPKKLEQIEVRRLIVCDKCGVETEGPFESGDHVFREVGPCPRCEGQLYLKAIYGIEGKTPLTRQQPLTETTVPEDKK
ncbi:MAG: hypothetical protein Q6364_09715 [Candidatus Hermodarchaeota archaeon]|jgi:hypothetical protein|nr:hypothetical protein [Candidatus Hermodarchaeota archaeon]